jgi:hypothetical protein
MKSRSIGGVTADAAAAAVEGEADAGVVAVAVAVAVEGGGAAGTVSAGAPLKVLPAVPADVLVGITAGDSTYVLVVEEVAVVTGAASGSSDKSCRESAGSASSSALTVTIVLGLEIGSGASVVSIPISIGGTGVGADAAGVGAAAICSAVDNSVELGVAAIRAIDAAEAFDSPAAGKEAGAAVAVGVAEAEAVGSACVGSSEMLEAGAGAAFDQRPDVDAAPDAGEFPDADELPGEAGRGGGLAAGGGDARGAGLAGGTVGAVDFNTGCWVDGALRGDVAGGRFAAAGVAEAGLVEVAARRVGTVLAPGAADRAAAAEEDARAASVGVAPDLAAAAVALGAAASDVCEGVGFGAPLDCVEADPAA